MSDVPTPDELRIELDPVIEEVGEKYQVDPLWIKAIIQQESGWDPFATRYEPNYQYLYRPELYSRSGLISAATEINMQKQSYGLGQIMGALAREQGLKGFLSQLYVPEINLEHIGIRLAALKKRSDQADYVFAGYNGGVGAMRKSPTGVFTNQKYVTGVGRHLSKLV